MTASGVAVESRGDDGGVEGVRLGPAPGEDLLELVAERGAPPARGP